jgi:hypothetical protein
MTRFTPYCSWRSCTRPLFSGPLSADMRKGSPHLQNTSSSSNLITEAKSFLTSAQASTQLDAAQRATIR